MKNTISEIKNSDYIEWSDFVNNIYIYLHIGRSATYNLGC